MSDRQSQNRVSGFVIRAFGPDNLYNQKERAMRVVEEAIELAQSVGVPAGAIARLVPYVYGRPVGEPTQELGGVGVTLLASAESLGVLLVDALETEIKRIESKDPEIFRRRNAEKQESGVGYDTDNPMYVQASQPYFEKLKKVLND